MARLAGLICGLGVAAGIVLSGVTPASQAQLGAQVTIQSLRSGELAIEPDGRFVEAASLEPSGIEGAARGVTTVTNQTAIPLALRARVLPSATNLDELLRVRISAGAKRIFDGNLGGLREWTQQSFRLQSAEREAIAVRAWLPVSPSGAYEARGTKLTLIWKTRPVQG